MATERKPLVDKASSFDLLDMRLGRIRSVRKVGDPGRQSYEIRADFGRFGVKTSVARLTMHAEEELLGRQIIGVINFEPKTVAGIISEFLCLGVQIPKAESGEATPVTPMIEAKLGTKLF